MKYFGYIASFVAVFGVVGGAALLGHVIASNCPLDEYDVGKAVLYSSAVSNLAVDAAEASFSADALYVLSYIRDCACGRFDVDVVSFKRLDCVCRWLAEIALAA